MTPQSCDLISREIIDEEMQVDHQVSGRSRYNTGQIVRDPNAPAKPPKFNSPMDSPVMGGRSSMIAPSSMVAPPMVRVGSDSGIGSSRMSTAPRGSEAQPHPQQMLGHGDNMEGWGEVGSVRCEVVMLGKCRSGVESRPMVHVHGVL